MCKSAQKVAVFALINSIQKVIYIIYKNKHTKAENAVMDNMRFGTIILQFL